MKRLKKKILGILLSIVMVLGLMPGMSLMTDAANSVTETITTVEGSYRTNYTFQGSYCDITAGVVDSFFGIRLGDNHTAVFAADQDFVITEISFNGLYNGTPVLTTTAGRVTQSGTTFTISGINNDTVTLGATGQPIFFNSVDVTLSETVTNHTVTYKVANGTWGDGTTADKTETVADGSSPAHVPTGMTASDGYTGGSWNTNPANATITADTTFTYTFTDPAAATTSFDIPVTFMGTPDGNNTGHIELDQQVAIDTTQDTFLDVMPDGFVMHLRPADQNNAPASISGTYEFTYNGTTYTGSFTASLSYIQSANAMVYVSFPIAFNNSGSDSSSSSGHHHHKCENGHIFSFQVLQAATTEKDGVGMWCCERCGIPDWNEHENAAPGEKVVISAYTVFNDTLENNIKAAESGATVSITTSRWVSVRRGVLEALAEKPGVTLTVNFEYQGMGYVIAIPGGDPALAGILASEDRFFGLMNLGNTYGLTAVEK